MAAQNVRLFSDTGEATLRIISVASEDDGVYTCVATNELGSTTSSASLRVLGKRTVLSHTSRPQQRGQELTVSRSAAAVSTDGVRVSWKDNFEYHYTEVVELGRSVCLHDNGGLNSPFKKFYSSSTASLSTGGAFPSSSVTTSEAPSARWRSNT